MYMGYCTNWDFVSQVCGTHWDRTPQSYSELCYNNTGQDSGIQVVSVWYTLGCLFKCVTMVTLSSEKAYGSLWDFI